MSFQQIAFMIENSCLVEKESLSLEI
jgi:hypothetical protein